MYSLPNIKVIKSIKRKRAENRRDEIELERHCQWPISLYYCRISLGGAGKAMATLSKCNRHIYHDYNAVPPVIFIIQTSWYTQKQNFRFHFRKDKFVRRTHNPQRGNSTESFGWWISYSRNTYDSPPRNLYSSPSELDHTGALMLSLQTPGTNCPHHNSQSLTCEYIRQSANISRPRVRISVLLPQNIEKTAEADVVICCSDVSMAPFLHHYPTFYSPSFL